MQPDLGSNRVPHAYRAKALPTELPDCLHIIQLVPVLTQVTPATGVLKKGIAKKPLTDLYEMNSIYMSDEMCL